MLEVIFEFNKSYLFGLFKFDITVADAKQDSGKQEYKTYIRIMFFTTILDFTVTSDHLGFLSIDGKEFFMG